NEELLKAGPASYLDIVDFITTFGTQIANDLNQLWRRMVFSILVSNTDDHLRNHGFILSDEGWRLSPAYDVNPSVDKMGLSLNIDEANNALDLELAKSVGTYFRLSNSEMNSIIDGVKKSVRNWETIANRIGISRSEQELMHSAFQMIL